MNKLPTAWQATHKAVLSAALADTPLITISREPMAWGENLIQTDEPSVENIYRQILRGAEHATTDYVAVVEDDTLYPASHFALRPSVKPLVYNFHRWVIFQWKPEVYQFKPKPATGLMIAERKWLIRELKRSTHRQEVATKHAETAYSLSGVVCVKHRWAHDYFQRHQKMRVRPVQAYEIPYWGRAETVMEPLR